MIDLPTRVRVRSGGFGPSWSFSGRKFLEESFPPVLTRVNGLGIVSHMTTNETEKTSVIERHIVRRKVIGSGGRPRTVVICEGSCWHNSYAQAMRCKYAQLLAAQGVRHNEVEK